MIKCSYKLILLFIIILFSQCQDSKPANIVARVGEEKILFDDFIYDFTMFPQYQSNVALREARLQHLDQMIDRVILYMAAEQEGLEELPEIQEKLDYIRHKEMLKFLYQKEVLDKIPISEEEAWEEYKKSNIQLKLRHLYAGTAQQTRQYYDRLQNGESFEKIARETFQDSTLANSGGDLGFVTVTDLDPFLADSVYSLRMGEISKPLRSSFGYHIFRIDDLKQSVFLSKENFLQNKDEYVNSLRQRRARVKSARYLSAVLEGKSVTIKASVLKDLVNINKTLVKPRRQESPLPYPAVTDAELQAISGKTAALKDRVLVEFNGGAWTVEEFLARLKQMPPMHRPAINTEKTLAPHIVDMMRDEYLLREAYRQGIQKRKEVVDVVEKWRIQLLADEFKKRILWVDYQKEDPGRWRVRKAAYNSLKTEVPVAIDTTMLFHDLTGDQLRKKALALPSVIRDSYIW